LLELDLLYLKDHFVPVLWHCWQGCAACNSCPQNDLLCVGWDVNALLTHATMLHCCSVSYLLHGGSNYCNQNVTVPPIFKFIRQNIY